MFILLLAIIISILYIIRLIDHTGMEITSLWHRTRKASCLVTTMSYLLEVVFELAHGGSNVSDGTSFEG